MAEWDPDLYLKFERDRLRPAIDLLGRIELNDPETIIDLGCGPGTSTKLLGEKFGNGQVTGIDNSAEMIEKAQVNYPAAQYYLSSIENWQAKRQVDLIYANAVFHWIEDHPLLICRLARMVGPGGGLAFQMPDNLAEPSHLAIGEMLENEPWKTIFFGLGNPRARIGTIYSIING